MKQSDKEELARFRERRKKLTDYNNKYNKENYKRMVCMHPISDSAAIDEAIKLPVQNPYRHICLCLSPMI